MKNESCMWAERVEPLTTLIDRPKVLDNAKRADGTLAAGSQAAENIWVLHREQSLVPLGSRAETELVRFTSHTRGGTHTGGRGRTPIMPMALFRDRCEAGRILAERVKASVTDPNALVLALPRGGVPVGFEVARALPAQLDVFLVRKLGMPGEEELAIGAIASGGVRVLNHDLVRYLRVPDSVIEQVTEREMRELERRERLYREDRPPISVQSKTVVLVDDGLATGASMMAASRALRPLGAARVVVAVPLAARQTCDEFRKEVDEIICAETPHPFGAVGIWYEDFSQTTDEDVRALLKLAARETPAPQPSHR